MKTGDGGLELGEGTAQGWRGNGAGLERERCRVREGTAQGSRGNGAGFRTSAAKPPSAN